MSVLLIGAAGERGEAIARRLIGQGDEVRAIELDPAAAEKLRALGVHIARGRDIDADLTERAAQNVRTIVVIDPTPDLTASVLEGVTYAKVGRVVACGDVPPSVIEALRTSRAEYVVLSERKRLLKRTTSPERLAEAVDAADDLAGEPRLELDLSEPDAWRELKLEGP
ncbi:MAG: NAD-binding protein [Actinomycetota bacterium]